jgi:hypothetical protein
MKEFLGRVLGLKPGVAVARVLPEDNYGIGVSTVLTSDEGYETALLDAHRAHPVERYHDERSAREGHDRWVVASRTLERIVELGPGDESGEVEIRRLPFGTEN